MSSAYPVQGSGLGLRRAFIGPLAESIPEEIDFLEVAPENWIDVGGLYGKQFSKIAEKRPIVCHGLSLNIGGFAPLDEAFIQKVKQFLNDFDVPVYSDHLTYCADEGQLYDLMPCTLPSES